ncbi:hypothetical protein [Actinokineospora diospyrosa]|uniref:hypothetical protein n=1 Tax=Actinokineospora diospyrosa TaxID=103728 RepID=UPI0020A36D97|nr:hypothetical protein [Actinokineospora diospyrosa]
MNRASLPITGSGTATNTQATTIHEPGHQPAADPELYPDANEYYPYLPDTWSRIADGTLGA